MKAFDTDILTEILAGNPAYAERIEQVPLEEQSAPVVAIEEILRGRLNVIRKAEAGKARITIDEAYRLFEETLDALRELKFLPFTPQAEVLLKEWRKSKVRGSTHDLRRPRVALPVPRRWSHGIAATLSTFRACRLSSGIDEIGAVVGVSADSERVVHDSRPVQPMRRRARRGFNFPMPVKRRPSHQRRHRRQLPHPYVPKSPSRKLKRVPRRRRPTRHLPKHRQPTTTTMTRTDFATSIAASVAR
jgi:tRNA(fMet)-specific endonuclease VapC